VARWSDFERERPDLAKAGRELLYRTGSGEALLATVGGDGPIRIHPIALAVRDGGLWAFVLPSPKLTDLQRDGRYALHAYPDAAVPREFSVSGHVRAVADDERSKLAADWPFDPGDGPAFEFLIDHAIVGERASRDEWPPRYRSWRATS
jgi:hypothetical protein